MKTRSHQPLSKNDTCFSPGQMIQEEKQVMELSLPSKKQKGQNDFQLLIKSTDYSRIREIPSVQLSIQDMNGDPLNLIAKLQTKYAQFGAVKLVCPPEWNPSQEFKYPKMNITTRIQPIHQLKLGKSFEEKKEVYTLSTFHEFAINFERKYKLKFPEQGDDRSSRLENEYWKLVEGVDKATQELNPKKYKLTVQYAADLPVNKYSSGFPRTISSKTKDKHFNYAENLYNLNNIYRSQKSLLNISDAKGEYIGGITIPWVYIGMMFSSFCWHVEDSNINSINYNHFGGKKIWYVIPESDKAKFDDFIQQKYGDKDVINKITYMINPLDLLKRNIKVFKAYQQPREFICTFFKAYHCGFSEAFNVGEAVNFVLPESLAYIKQTIKKSLKPSLFCYQWLIYENYFYSLKNMPIGNISSQIKQEYHQILEKQEKNLNKIFQRFDIKNVQTIDEKTKYTRYMCTKCKCYLYLSFLKCQKCHKDYCFNDVQKCCQTMELMVMMRKPNLDRQRYINKLIK